MGTQKVSAGQGTARAVVTKEDFAATRQPLLQASTLPPYCYSSREFYELEVERIFMREWLCVGRADQVEKPGDYYTINLLGEPLVVTRDLEGRSACCLPSAVTGGRRSYKEKGTADLFSVRITCGHTR